MEQWQREHIRKNLSELIVLTDCNSILRASLVKSYALSAADDNILNVILSNDGKFAESRKLYGILETRKKGYEKLVQALIESNQSGAVQILHNDIRELAFIKTEVQFMGKLRKIEDILQHPKSKDIIKIIEAIENDPDFSNYFVAREKTLELVPDTIPKPVSFYVPRLISNRVNVSPLIFKEKCDDVFVLHGINRLQLTQLALTQVTSISRKQLDGVTCRFILLENFLHWKHIKNNAQKKKITIHLIKYERDPEAYILEETCSRSDELSAVLSRHISQKTKSESDYISKDDLIAKLEGNKSSSGIRICDTPGMGKTLLLANLARKLSKMFPNRVVAFLPLFHFTEKLDNSGNLANIRAINVVTNYICLPPISRKILIEAFQRGLIKLELFFDGYDEILTAKLNLATECLKHLTTNQVNIRVNVSSRPHHRSSLEQSLNVISYDIKPFTTSDQTQFLATFWKKQIPSSEEILLQECAKVFVETLNKALSQKEKDIMGIPLQCYLFGHICLEKAKQFVDIKQTSPKEYVSIPTTNIFELYNKFLNNRLNQSVGNKAKFSSEKSKQGADRSIALMKAFHTWKALQIFFPEIAKEYARNEKLSDKMITRKIFSFGILESMPTSNGKTADFLHRTIAEFLVAEFFAKWLVGIFNFRNSELVNSTKQGQLMTACLSFSTACDYTSQQQWEIPFSKPVILFFLNAHLRKILSDSISVNKLLINSFSLAVLPVDFWRLFGCLVKENYLYLIQFVRHTLENIDTSNLQNYRACLRRESMYDTFYKRATSRLQVIFSMTSFDMDMDVLRECLLVYQDIFGININDIPGKDYPLIYGCRNGNYELVEYISNTMDINDESLIIETIEMSFFHLDRNIDGKINILELLLSKNPSLLKNEVMWKSKSISGPLAVNSVHFKILKYLIEKGADVYATEMLTPINFDTHTVITQNCRHLSAPNFSELLSILSNMNCLDKLLQSNITISYYPVHYILEHRNSLELGTLDFILKTSGIDVSTKNRHGNNLLFSAVIGLQPLLVLKELIKRETNFKEKNNKEESLLHVAAKQKHNEALQYFLELGLPINDKTVNGDTPLFETGDIEIYNILLDHGADIQATNKVGNSILHKSAKQNSNFKECISFLVSRYNPKDVADIFKLENNEKQTALHIFKLWYQEKETASLFLGIREIVLEVMNHCNDCSNNVIYAAATTGRLKDLDGFVQHGLDNLKWTIYEQKRTAIMSNIDTFDFFSSINVLADDQEVRWADTPVSFVFKTINKFEPLVTERTTTAISNYGNEVLAYITSKNMNDTKTQKILDFFTQSGISEEQIDTERKTNLLNFPADLTCLHQILVRRETFAVRYGEFDPTNKELEWHSVFLLFEAFEFKTLKSLVNCGVNYLIKDSRGRSLLQLAVTKNESLRIEYLLSIGMSPNEQCSLENMNYPNLLFLDSDINTTICLLGKCDLNVIDNFGDTFLHKAAQRMRLSHFHKLIDYLLENQIGLNNFNSVNLKGETPLLAFLKHNKEPMLLDTLKLLLSHKKVNLNGRDLDGFNIFLAGAKQGICVRSLTLLFENGADCNISCETGENALHFAVKNGIFDNVKYLLSIGLSPNAYDNQTNTPLHLAHNTLLTNNLEIIKLLIINGADPFLGSKDGNTIAHIVFFSHFFELANFLIDKGHSSVLWKTENAKGIRAMHMYFYSFIKKWEALVCRIATTLGPSVNDKENEGFYLFPAAVFGLTVDSLKQIFGCGVDYRHVYSNGETYLHLAAKAGNWRIIEYLLSLGLPQNGRDIYGNTPLLVCKTFLSMNILISHGANVFDADNDGNTLLHKAAERLSNFDLYRLTLVLKQEKAISCLIDTKNLKDITPCQLLISTKRNKEFETSSSSDDTTLILNPFFEAVERKASAYLLLTLAEWSGQVHSMTVDGKNALHFLAAQSFDAEKKYSQGERKITDDQCKICTLLLRMQIDVNQTDQNGQTPLELAEETLRLHNTNSVTEDRTKYDEYIIEQKNIIKLLKEAPWCSQMIRCENAEDKKDQIEKEADLGFQDKENNNVAHIAAKILPKEEFHLLVSYIVTIDRNGDKIFKCKNMYGHTPLHTRLHFHNQIKLETLLLLINIPGYDVVRQLDNAGNNLLLSAVVGGNKVEILEILVSASVDFTVKNMNGYNAIQYAFELLGADVFKYLLSLGLSQTNLDKTRCTMLMLATKDIEEIKHYIEIGDNISIVDFEGYNIVHILAVNLSEDEFHHLVIFLLNERRDVKIFSVQNKDGHTSIAKRLYRKPTKPETFRMLLEFPEFDKSVLDWCGDNLIFLAIEAKLKVPEIEVFIENGVDYKSHNSLEDNVLHYAARYGHEEAAKYFVSLGVDKRHPNNKGISPLDEAKDKFKEDGSTLCQQHIVEILSSSSSDDRTYEKYEEKDRSIAQPAILANNAAAAIEKTRFATNSPDTQDRISTMPPSQSRCAHQPVPPQHGIKNVGMTCYFNSTLQAIFCLPITQNAILKDPFSEPFNTYFHLTRQRSMSEKEAWDLKLEFDYVSGNLFPTGTMHCVHELLLSLFTFDDFKYLKNSVTFAIKRQQRCIGCDSQNTMETEENYLGIPPNVDIDETCLLFGAKKVIQFNCEKCLGKKAMEISEIEQSPEHLILITSPRDDSQPIGEQFWSEKVVIKPEFNRIHRKVNLPVSNCFEKYQLQSFITHSGSNLNSGHYRAYVCCENSYFECDDEWIKSCKGFQGDVYLQIFRRINQNL